MNSYHTKSYPPFRPITVRLFEFDGFDDFTEIGWRLHKRHHNDDFSVYFHTSPHSQKGVPFSRLQDKERPIPVGGEKKYADKELSSIRGL